MTIRRIAWLWWWTFVAGPFFRTLMHLGMWEVSVEGGYYWQDGRAPWMHIHG